MSSLSEQHILSPINPTYDDWFCKIYEALHKLFYNSKLAKLVFEFQHNLCKSSLIWQNQSLYFGLISEKICWSVKEQSVQYEVYQYVMSWLDLKTLKNHK